MEVEQIWEPQKIQKKLLESCHDEILFGGAKGGGKTDVLLFDAVRFIKEPGYKAIILRRTFPRLREIINRSMVFRKMGGVYNRSEKVWRFPSGSQLFFGHCQNEGDELNYQGHQYHYIGFDQVEEFTEDMFNIISACGRKVDDIPVRIRCTANPGGIGQLWVKRRWLDGKEPNKTYFVTQEVQGKLIKRSMKFIPSNIYDNEILTRKNPEYIAYLLNLPEKFRRMYLEGDFNIEDAPDQLITYEMLKKVNIAAKLKEEKNGVEDPGFSGRQWSEIRRGGTVDEIFLGVDVARFGDDSTEIAFVKGNSLIKIETYTKKDINQTAQILLRKIREDKIKPENIGIDTVGLGAGVYDIIRSNGFRVNEIISGGGPIELWGENYRFRNLRCQMHWHFRELLREGNFSINIHDRELEEEMLSVRYEISSEKMITIEAKEEIKKRIGRSTNKHDAVVYAAFVPVIKQRGIPHLY